MGIDCIFYQENFETILLWRAIQTVCVHLKMHNPRGGDVDQDIIRMT